MAKIAEATVKAVNTVGAGKVVILTLLAAGREAPVKAWANNPLLANVKDGTVLKDIETETKPAQGNYPAEVWLKEPPKSGGGGRGGGVAKSDPAKNAVIEKANQNNNRTMALGNARNNAVVIIGWAREDIPDHSDPNVIASRAKDYSDMVKDIAMDLLGVDEK